MILSDTVKNLIGIIENNGFEAYAVGGCVRDSLMGISGGDIDITTSAKPNELENILANNNIKFVETGLKHGTITAVIDSIPYEITTFRTDGTYLDNRHPDKVEFVTNLNDDLARRDFTINAMAYNDTKGLVDIYGGRQDIDNKLIRCVGDANRRFNEDALRIMRAIRFSSVLGFDIEEQTKKAIFDNKELLKNISVERIFKEMSKLLMGDNVFNVLCEYKEVIGVAVPELSQIFDVPQNSKWHCYDVWTHTAKAVELAKKDVYIRWITLFHDTGKGDTHTTDKNGIDHFKNHQSYSATHFENAGKHLKMPLDLFERGVSAIAVHDKILNVDRNEIRWYLATIGETHFRDMIDLMRADKMAHNYELVKVELNNLDIIEEIMNDIIKNGEVITLKELAINGNDLLELGFYGPKIGATLNYLLTHVNLYNVENEKSALLKFINEQ